MGKKEKDVKVTVYVAFDGTEFNTETECLEYEGSAVGVLLERIKNSILKKVDDLGFLPKDSGYTGFNQYYMIMPKTRTDVFVLNQILSMVPDNEETVVADDCYNLIGLALDLRCNVVVNAHVIKFNEIVKALTNKRFNVISFIKEGGEEPRKEIIEPREYEQIKKLEKVEK